MNDRVTADPSIPPSLATTLHQLWPGARIEGSRAVQRGRPRTRGTVELVALPDLARQRLLLPASSPAAASAVHRFSAAATGREVLTRVAAGAALRAGGAALLRERVRILPGEEESITDHLAQVLGLRTVHVSLSLGPRRVNRKPVLQIFDVDGRSRGFAKVGSSSASAAVVEAEGEALRVLGGTSFRTLRVPRVLSMESWRGHPVLVQEDLGVSARSLLLRSAVSTARGPWRPDRAMAELEERFRTSPQPVADTGWWTRCRTAARHAPDGTLGGELLAAMSRLEQEETPVPLSAWHGDWTPWNSAPVRGGRTLVWDWERFEPDVPAGLDRVHYAVNQATSSGTSWQEVRDAARRSASHPRGAQHYLVAAAARYLAMSAEEHGELIEERARATLRALTALL